MEPHVQVGQVIAVLPLCPFPPLHWWFLALGHHAGSSVIATNESFVKQSFRNRLQLVQADGAFNVSFPVKQAENSLNMMTNTAVLSSHVQPKVLWRSIQTAYGAAPFFEHFAPELEALWLQFLPATPDDHKLLSDWCDATLHWMANTCNWTLPSISEDPIAFQPQLDLRERLALRGHGWTFNRYTQLYEDRQPFVGGLSALDALFILGPNELNARLPELVKHPARVD